MHLSDGPRLGLGPPQPSDPPDLTEIMATALGDETTGGLRGGSQAPPTVALRGLGHVRVLEKPAHGIGEVLRDPSTRDLGQADDEHRPRAMSPQASPLSQ